MWSDLGSIWSPSDVWDLVDMERNSPLQGSQITHTPHAPFLFFHHDERWTVFSQYLLSFRFHRVIVAHWGDKPRPSLLILGRDIVSSPLILSQYLLHWSFNFSSKLIRKRVRLFDYSFVHLCIHLINCPIVFSIFLLISTEVLRINLNICFFIQLRI